MLKSCYRVFRTYLRGLFWVVTSLVLFTLLSSRWWWVLVSRGVVAVRRPSFSCEWCFVRDLPTPTNLSCNVLYCGCVPTSNVLWFCLETKYLVRNWSPVCSFVEDVSHWGCGCNVRYTSNYAQPVTDVDKVFYLTSLLLYMYIWMYCQSCIEIASILITQSWL